MSSRRKPTAKEISAMLNQAVPPPAQIAPQPDAPAHPASSKPSAETNEQPTIQWRKSTIPFREDQHKEIGRLLSKLHQELDVQLTIAEVVRLGLDQMIAALSDEAQRAGALQELYQQQQREAQGNENIKHSRSQGLGRYLAVQKLSSNQT